MEEELILNIFLSAVCLMLVLFGIYYIIAKIRWRRKEGVDEEALVSNPQIRDAIQIQGGASGWTVGDWVDCALRCSTILPSCSAISASFPAAPSRDRQR